MTVIAIVALAVGTLIVTLCALADPVLLSRINGEDTKGSSGRHIPVSRHSADVVRLPLRGESVCGTQAA
ncbi:hypothetical protein [Sinosporangium siamense]|uniref:Uncharacterized protein n=1 Tax=Sinosporangium siamense TaxID=1367973 RepID=A0A919RGC9_9ACTN|nr:hypothetical protein [Sinosporangium siamense]GII93232.1 hypothetical protein Ssi02_34630 [Sinosporangium siamense]